MGGEVEGYVVGLNRLCQRKERRPGIGNERINEKYLLPLCLSASIRTPILSLNL